MTTRFPLAAAARNASAATAARARASHLHLLADQRRFVLAVEAEVAGAVEALFKKFCEPSIEGAVTAGASYALIDIPTYYGDEEPVRPEFWWKPGVRCKAIVRHLTAYLKGEGFSVSEGDPYVNRNPPGKRRGQICMHAVPLTVSW